MTVGPTVHGLATTAVANLANTGQFPVENFANKANVTINAGSRRRRRQRRRGGDPARLAHPDRRPGRLQRPELRRRRPDRRHHPGRRRGARRGDDRPSRLGPPDGPELPDDQRHQRPGPGHPGRRPVRHDLVDLRIRRRPAGQRRGRELQRRRHPERRGLRLRGHHQLGRRHRHRRDHRARREQPDHLPRPGLARLRHAEPRRRLRPLRHRDPARDQHHGPAAGHDHPDQHRRVVGGRPP